MADLPFPTSLPDLHEFPPCRLPLISKMQCHVNPLQVDRVATALSELLDRGGSDQTSLAVGLCNALSFDLDAMMSCAQTKEHYQILLAFEEHLESVVNTMAFQRRNR